MITNTRAICTIRCTDALKNIVEQTAAKCGISISEVCRCAARGLCRGRRTVTGFEVPKAVTESGDEFLRVEGGITIPDMCKEAHYRKVLYLRCMEELAKPAHVAPRVEAVAGVDYMVEAVNA